LYYHSELVIQIKSSYRKIMLHVCKSEFEVWKVLLPTTLPLTKKLFNVSFIIAACIHFYGKLAFLLSALLNADWPLFHWPLEKLLSPTWVFFVCSCAMQWYLSATFWPREVESHYFWQKENHFFIEVRYENGFHELQFCFSS
jgi:hypothetical protein